jgi:hypothetical protein
MPDKAMLPTLLKALIAWSMTTGGMADFLSRPSTKSRGLALAAVAGAACAAAPASLDLPTPDGAAIAVRDGRHDGRASD